jgi:hypothetical protein
MWWNHRGCVEAKQICAGNVVVRSTKIGLDHNTLRLGGLPKVSRDNMELCNRLINKTGLSPFSLTSCHFHPSTPLSKFSLSTFFLSLGSSQEVHR